MTATDSRSEEAGLQSLAAGSFCPPPRVQRRVIKSWFRTCSSALLLTIATLHNAGNVPPALGKHNGFALKPNPVSVGIWSAVRRSSPLLMGSSISSIHMRRRSTTTPAAVTSKKQQQQQPAREMDDLEMQMCGFGTTRQRSAVTPTDIGSETTTKSTTPTALSSSASCTEVEDGRKSIQQIPSGGEAERRNHNHNNSEGVTKTTSNNRSSKKHNKGKNKSANELVFWENMVCGAISRSVAQTVMHPANTMKTIMQAERVSGGSPSSFISFMHPSKIGTLARGAGAQFLLSVPHGAINFAVLEYVRLQLNRFVQQDSQQQQQQKNNVARGGSAAAAAAAAVGARRFSLAAGPTLDFMSSAISTICCSIVSTPQMMLTDNIMAGRFANLPQAVNGLMKEGGIMGFYSGWWPGLAGKIPSYVSFVPFKTSF